MALITQFLKEFDDEQFDNAILDGLNEILDQISKEFVDEHLDNTILDAFVNAIFERI